MASSPITRWPATPDWPARVTRLPSLVLPAMPLWAARIESSPIRTLCATWTRLSIFVPRPITVVPREARSIVTFAPISTSSSILRLPTWGILRCFPPDVANPNPSLPSTAPLCTMTRRPIFVPG